MIITMLVYFYLFVFQYFKFNSVFVILLISSANIQLFHSPPPYKPIPFLPMQSVWRSWFLNHFPMAGFSTMFSMIVFTMISTMSTWFVFIHTLLVSEVSLHHFSITSQWPPFCGPTRRMRPVACRLCKCFAIPLSAISSSFAMAREVI